MQAMNVQNLMAWALTPLPHLWVGSLLIGIPTHTSHIRCGQAPVCSSLFFCTLHTGLPISMWLADLSLLWVLRVLRVLRVLPSSINSSLCSWDAICGHVHLSHDRMEESSHPRCFGHKQERFYSVCSSSIALGMAHNEKQEPFKQMAACWYSNGALMAPKGWLRVPHRHWHLEVYFARTEWWEVFCQDSSPVCSFSAVLLLVRE